MSKTYCVYMVSFTHFIGTERAIVIAGSDDEALNLFCSLSKHIVKDSSDVEVIGLSVTKKSKILMYSLTNI